MGNWNVNIQGVGAHHNSDPKNDANEAAKEFVAKLISQGHKILSASFTYGAEDWLLDDPDLNTRCNPGELARTYQALREEHKRP